MSERQAPDNASPAPELKGKLFGTCNRPSCLKSPALYYHTDIQAYYCHICAHAMQAVQVDVFKQSVFDQMLPYNLAHLRRT